MSLAAKDNLQFAIEEGMETGRMAYKRRIEEFINIQSKITEEAKKKSHPPTSFKAQVVHNRVIHFKQVHAVTCRYVNENFARNTLPDLISESQYEEYYGNFKKNYFLVQIS